MSEENTNKPSFKTAEELTNFLMDLQGQIATMQETMDKLNPVEENAEGSEGESSETGEGEGVKKEEMTDQEVSEIDQLLQAD